MRTLAAAVVMATVLAVPATTKTFAEIFKRNANVRPIRHLVDKVAQHVFADLVTFILDRTVQSFIDADEKRGP